MNDIATYKVLQMYCDNNVSDIIVSDIIVVAIIQSWYFSGDILLVIFSVHPSQHFIFHIINQIFNISKIKTFNLIIHNFRILTTYSILGFSW